MIIDGDEDWRYSETFGTLGRGNRHGVQPATARRSAPRKPYAAGLALALAVISAGLLLSLLLQALA